MRNRNGFSLVEIICVLVILGVLGSFASVGISRVIKLYLAVKDTDVAIQQAQIAMNRLFIEIISVDTTATAHAYALDNPGAATPSTTYKIPSLDGATIVDNVITYVASTKTLSLNGAPLCQNVTAFSMQQDTSGIGVSSLKYVTVAMTVTVNGKSQVLTSQVTIKSLS